MNYIDKEATKQKYLKALEKTKGNVTKACKQGKLDRTMFYKYKKEDAEFAKAVEDIKESQIEFVEEKLYEAIGNLDSTLIKYYLQTKGRKYGWGSPNESLDITTNGETLNTQPIINISVIASKENSEDSKEK